MPGKFTPAVSAVERETISGAASGAFSNTANYLNSDGDHTVLGAVQSFGAGAFWGGGTAGLGARFKANQWVPGFAPVEKFAEKSVVKNAVTNLVSDSFAGGVNSVGVYLSAPPEQYGVKNIEGASEQFFKGAGNGALKSVSKSAPPVLRPVGTTVKERALMATDYVLSPFETVSRIAPYLK